MRILARLLLGVLLAWAIVPAYSQTSPQLINTTPGSADDLPQGAAKLNADITALWNAVFNGGGGGGSGGSGGGYANIVDLCTYPGIDPSGAVTTSYASILALQAAVNQVAGTNYTLQVGCPVRLHQAMGATGAAQAVFIPSGVHFNFLPSGKFIVDNMGVNPFIIVHATDVVFNNMTLLYDAPFGANGISNGFGAFPSGWPTEYEVTLQNYLHTSFNITFPSGVAPVNNTSAFMAVFNIRGTSNVTFNNFHAYVPTGATAGNFIPELFYVWPEFLPNVTAVSVGTSISSANAAIPAVTINGGYIDGTDMAFVGIAQLTLNDVVSNRYSDLQDGTSGTISFAGSFASGASSATLASVWTLPTGQYCPTLSNAQLVCMTLTQGSTTATNFTNSSGAATTVSSAATATATSGNVGGIGNWFAPPHFVYVWGQTGNYLSNAFPYWSHFHNVLDLGNYVGIATRRSRGSGSILSLKTELAGGTTIDGYTSLRPDGWLDLECGNTGGGTMNNITVQWNSTTATADSGLVFAVRTPQTCAYNDVVMNNVTITDTAAEPAGFAATSQLFNPSSYDIAMTNWKIFMNDVPLAATFYPGFDLEGDHLNVQAEIHYANYSQSQTFRPPLDEQGANYFTDSNIDIAVFGYRQFPVVFSAALASGATTGTLAAVWPYSSGTYKVTFPDAEQRYIAFTNNSTTVGSFIAVAAAEPASGATAGNGLVNNYNGYNARAVFNGTGKGFGNYVHIRDVDSSWEVTSRGWVSKEEWTQEFVVNGNDPGWFQNYTGGVGTSLNTPIYFPTTFIVDQLGWNVETAFTGATSGFEIGENGTPALLDSPSGGQYVSTSSNVNYQPIATAVMNNNVQVTSLVGTVTGGTATLAVHGTSMLGTH